MLILQNQISFSVRSAFFHEIHASTTLACPNANTKASENEPFQSKPTQAANLCISQGLSFTGMP